jgi:ankyrin repeat protein
LQAAEKSEYEAALVALRHGASPNARGFFNMSPLLWAVSNHNLPLVKLLLDYDADPNQPKKDGVTPIFLATVSPPADVNDLSIANLLVERGADVNRRSDTHDTPLIWVGFYGHVPIAKFLLQHGADVNAVDQFGQTPVNMAERQHHEDMISFLTGHGAIRR